MIQLHFPAGKPSVEEVAAALGVDVSKIDAEFGVIPTDPTRHLYTVRVDEEVAREAQSALDARESFPGEGAFGEVKIAPFGPPKD